LEYLNRAWASHLIKELKEIEGLEDAWVPRYGDGFAVKELIDDVQNFNPRGIKHIKLWIEAQERLRQIRKDIVATNLIKSRFFLKRKNKIALIFFPCNREGFKDAGRIYSSYVTNKHKRVFWYNMFEEVRYNCYANIFDNLDPRKIPKSIMLFAHSNEETDGFLVNPSSVRNSSEIQLKWWKCDINYDWLFAHVCNGAAILNRPEWHKVFPNWLSYSDDIYSFVATQKGNSCWKSIIKLILEVIPKCKSIKCMKEQLKTIYRNAMAELASNYEPKYGDTLNLIYLENCIQSIKTSEDKM
jgi:hypothetical protein